MSKSNHSEAQMIGALKQLEAGPVATMHWRIRVVRLQITPSLQRSPPLRQCRPWSAGWRDVKRFQVSR
jgi:hypothetical protein